MATATKKGSPATSSDVYGERALSSLFDHIASVVDVIYRFLASLKLAVLSLTALASTLAYATFFESWYGAARHSSTSTGAQDSRSCWRFWG